MPMISLFQKNKYGNQTCGFNGRIYPSKLQRDRAMELHALASCGSICDLQEEVTFALKVNDCKVCSIRLDFVYTKDGVKIYEDSKGVLEKTQEIKYKLFSAITGNKVFLSNRSGVFKVIAMQSTTLKKI